MIHSICNKDLMFKINLFSDVAFSTYSEITVQVISYKFHITAPLIWNCLIETLMLAHIM